jgi:hypothetical protein
VAARKGHSFLGYFIFSLFLWPFALITAYVVKYRTTVRGHPAVWSSRRSLSLNQGLRLDRRAHAY